VIKFTLFFLSLSLLIILHEFGHYITARWFKAKVDKFYLFFDFFFPFANVFKFSLFKKKIGDTEYGIGWFPFGGYVDIAGMMADENGDSTTTPKPHEFRGKKPWQRLIILAGGIIVNFVLAIVIYSMMMWHWGEEYLPAANAKYGVYCDSLALEMGMKHGDKVLSIDGKPVENLNQAAIDILLNQPKNIQVDRNGEKVNIVVTKDLDKKLLSKKGDSPLAFSVAFPFVIDSFPAKSPAQKAGLQIGDSLVSVNKDTLPIYQYLVSALVHNKGKTISVGFYRKDSLMSLTLPVDAEGHIGAFNKPPKKYFEFKKKTYTFLESWGRGTSLTMQKLVEYVKQFRLLFSKEGASKIGGFATMAKAFPEGWDWEHFWGITAYISLILAFMNLLPIPVLDGGYILFVLWEMITGKKPSDKFMSRALSVGMFIVLALLVFANGNDILRAITK
jgi:regulator of sigma E protease